MPDVPGVEMSCRPTSRKPLRRRWYVRLPAFLLTLYLIAAAAVYLVQDKLIFVGSRSQGSPRTQIPTERGTELVHLTLPDGTPIVALFATATDAGFHELQDAPSRPTFLYFYGNGSTVAWSIDEVDRFRQLGVNVLVPDYPGYGQSGGQASEKSLDATADVCWDWLRANRRRVDPGRIVAVGWSLGTGVAVDVATRRPVVGLITFNAYTSIPAMARIVMPWIPTTLMVRTRLDSLSKMPSVKCPAMLITGRLDAVIPPTMSDALARAAGGPVTQLMLPDADHVTVFSADSATLYPAMTRFLENLRRN